MAGAGCSGVKLEDFRIPFEEIKLGTGNFSPENYIGGGGFGKVYKGKLSGSRNYNTAAIKRLDPNGLQGKHEFLNEISMLFSYKHKNIIDFIGYCDELDEMIIVYEYAVNQSLDKYLGNTNKMSSISWEQRLKICIGAAQGLNYLHSGLGEHHRVIHRDIKSANILLDENLVSKISDFGLSKIGPKDLPYTHLHTKVAGTLHYCDPNYYGTNVLKKESDVYSFGVVLFEMLCGRLVFRRRGNEDDEPESLLEWVRCCYKDRVDRIIDPRIRDRIQSKSLSTFMEIAYRCIKINVKKRPTMCMIVEKLEEALEFQDQQQFSHSANINSLPHRQNQDNLHDSLSSNTVNYITEEKAGDNYSPQPTPLLSVSDGVDSYVSEARMDSQLPCVLVLSGKSASEKELAKALKEKKSLKLADNIEVLTFLQSDKENLLEKANFQIDSYMGSLSTTCFGRFLLCSPRLPSTKDVAFLNFSELPVGSVCIADVQFKGQVWMKNVWESPKGSLVFSFTLQIQDGSVLPLIQYVVCVAMTEAIKDLTHKNGIPALDVRIRWPNDLYLDGLKVGDFLCSSEYKSKKFNVTAGVVLYVDNDKPTTSLNAKLRKLTSDYQLCREDIMAAFFNKFENLFFILITQGFQPLEELYYKAWLHSGQRVTVQEKSEDQELLVENVVTIQGLTSSGYLLAIGDDGRMCELHPHGNSVDFFKGLVRKKLA